MDNNFVITFGRTIGSGGLDIAKALGEELGVKVYDKNLLEEVAKAHGLHPEMFVSRDERSSRNLKSILNFRSILRGTSNAMPNNVMTDEDMFKMQSDVMRSIAENESCIFVGRCSDYILREHKSIFNVFVTAPLGSRVKHVMARHGFTEDQALRHIRRIEASRADYYNYYTFKKWGDSSSYDLCIDIEKVGGQENALEIIKLAATRAGLQLTK